MQSCSTSRVYMRCSPCRTKTLKSSDLSLAWKAKWSGMLEGTAIDQPLYRFSSVGGVKSGGRYAVAAGVDAAH